MVPTANGYSPRPGVFRDALDAIHELHCAGMPGWDFLEMEPILDSSDMAVDEWNKIGSVIAENYARYDGFVVMHGTDTMAYTFGAGNIPSAHGNLLPIVERAVRSGTVVTVCSQCPQGTVSLGTYATSHALKRAGAVSGHDLTTEAAVAKLYYLFSKGLCRDEIKSAMERSVCGELSQWYVSGDRPESSAEGWRPLLRC